jgi:aspartate-semialdehyde dehydrogenase
MSLRLVVLGATGLVGRTMLDLVAARGWNVARPRLLASERTSGRTVPFRGEALPVEAVHPAAFDEATIALFACGNDVSREWAPVARSAGAVVIDNSSAFRYDDDVPLVVPEINSAALESRPTLVANPNCSTIGIVMALAPLMARRRLRRVWTATYQSVSGAGSEALERLEREVRDATAAPGATPVGADPFAFNVVPRIDRFEPNGSTREEMKVVWETRKILDLADLPVSVTAVRVPVRVGHAAAVTAWYEPAITPDEARREWAAFPGVRVVDDPATGAYPTPLAAAGGDPVLVGRARVDTGDPSALTFFVASDNLRKGAALNAVQIGEAWLQRFAAAMAPETR